MKSITDIQGFHAHVYYDAEHFLQAQDLCNAAAAQFDLKLGHMHKKPVGPHPCWSCQLAFTPDVFAALIPWLAFNRDGLVIFIHPESGDVLADHLDHAIWMGAVKTLNLTMFETTKI